MLMPILKLLPQILERNIEVYKLLNIRIKQVALYDTDGIGVINYDKDRSRTSIRTNFNRKTLSSGIIHLTSLDNTLEVTP